MQKKNRKQVFVGAATALITPFDISGEVDYAAFGRLIERQREAEVKTLVINGTTAEACCLTREERDETLSFAVKNKGETVIIAGTGSNSTNTAIENTLRAADVGADAALVVLPYYNNPGADGVIRHFYSIADASPIPIIAYDVPSRTGISLSPSVAAKLSEHPNVVGLKEADCSIAKITAIKAACRKDFSLYSGSDSAITALLAVGGTGAITVTGNIFPRLTNEICDSFFRGDCNESARLQLLLRPLIGELFAFVSPSPIKALMAHAGLIENVLRLPLTALNTSECERLFALWNEIKGEEEKCARQ